MVQEKDNVLRILKEAKEAIKKDDTIALKNLSDQTIHTSSIYRDEDNIAIAVIVYALSKIVERTRYREYPKYSSFMKNILLCIDRAVNSLEKNQDEYFRQQLKCIREEINKLTGNFKKHVQEIFNKAEISKASRIYEHGISLEKTAKLLGVSIWELTEYTGKTGISDVNFNITLPVKTRIKNAEDFFR